MFSMSSYSVFDASVRCFFEMRVIRELIFAFRSVTIPQFINLKRGILTNEPYGRERQDSSEVSACEEDSELGRIEDDAGNGRADDSFSLTAPVGMSQQLLASWPVLHAVSDSRFR